MAVSPSLCEQNPGFCMGDPACPDTNCPGRPATAAPERQQLPASTGLRSVRFLRSFDLTRALDQRRGQ